MPDNKNRSCNTESDWPFVPLRDVAKFGSGTTPHRAKHERYYVGGDIPWVKTGDLNNGVITTTDEQLTQIALDESGCKVFPKETVLIAMYGGFKQIGRTGYLKKPGAINQALTAVMVDQHRLNPLFLLEWLNSRVAQWRTLASSSRKDPNITKSDIARFIVPTPSLCVQDEVVRILNEWNKAIAKTHRLLTLKRRLKRGLMQQLLTGRRRFPEFAGEPWREVTIGDVAIEVSGRPADPATTVLSCTKHRGLVDSFEYFGRRVHGKNLEAYKTVLRGEFAYATNHIEEGSIGLLRHRDVGLVSPMYTVFQIADDVDASYLFSVLKTEAYRRHFARRTVGSVNRRGGLRWKDFSQILLDLPSFQEQQKIAAVLSTADREIALLEEQLGLLREQKKGLMQKLLTGQVRVKV